MKRLKNYLVERSNILRITTSTRIDFERKMNNTGQIVISSPIKSVAFIYHEDDTNSMFPAKVIRFCFYTGTDWLLRFEKPIKKYFNLRLTLVTKITASELQPYYLIKSDIKTFATLVILGLSLAIPDKSIAFN